MNLKILRSGAPEWKWTANRSGFGWHYEGERDGRRVVLRRMARLIDEDEFSTEWFAGDEPFAIWWMRESHK